MDSTITGFTRALFLQSCVIVAVACFLARSRFFYEMCPMDTHSEVTARRLTTIRRWQYG
ncbi:MAG: hypothetical protein WCH85_09885 [Methanomicrobiales archaeon]